MCQGISHAGYGVPGVVVRPHFILVLGEIANGLIAAASGACICGCPLSPTDDPHIT